MTKEKAFELRNQYKDELIGTQMKGLGEGWNVRDLIVSDNANLSKVCEFMYQNETDNITALSNFKIGTDDFDVYVISHQWPWGSGNLLTSRLDKYLQRK